MKYAYCSASKVRHPSEVRHLQFMTILKSFYCPVTAYMYTRVVTKINGHRDKRSSNLSNLNSVKTKLHKLNNKINLNNAYHDIWLFYIIVKPF